MNWKVYYGDGTVYEGDPWQAPGPNAQVLVQYVPHREILHGKGTQSYYCYYADQDWWNLADLPGLMDYLMLRPGPQKVLFGRTLRNDEFWAILARAERENPK